MIEPEPGDAQSHEEADLLIQTHGMDPLKVLRLAKALGALTRSSAPRRLRTGALGTDEDPVMGLSAPVESAIGEAIRIIDSLVAELLRSGRLIIMSLEVNDPNFGS